MNSKIASCLTSSLFIFCLALSANAETVLERIQRTGILRVAIREDATPFGYLDSDNRLQGYCLDFFNLLETKLIQSLDRNTLSTKLLESTPGNRFTLVSNNVVDLECGPNTIRPDIPENTDFSHSFFTTGTQFLVKKNNRNQIDVDRDLKNLKLGLVGNTTTEKFIAERYPLAKIERFGGVRARIRGIQAVEQGKIDAMVSDGILLRAEAQQQGLSESEYPLIPDTPLTCDRYGMIVRGNDPQWQDFINSVINSPEAAALSNTWFDRLFIYTQAAQDFCD